MGIKVGVLIGGNKLENINSSHPFASDVEMEIAVGIFDCVVA